MYSGALAKAGDTSPATIPVERINGPILMMSGQEDDVWPSADMAHRIEAQLQKAGFTHDVETIVYGGLSHSILGASPTAIPRTLDFFKRALAK
jgi:alpha-beta hydrolase superfamily lysophospholipase